MKKSYREIMSEILERELLPDEEVHHINGNHEDDHPLNLYVCSKEDHRKLQKYLRGLQKEEKEAFYSRYSCTKHDADKRCGHVRKTQSALSDARSELSETLNDVHQNDDYMEEMEEQQQKLVKLLCENAHTCPNYNKEKEQRYWNNLKCLHDNGGL
jgi:hypothetical protein